MADTRAGPVMKRVVGLLPAMLAVPLILSIAWRSPRFFDHIMQEDGWAEWATFLSFLGALCVAVLSIKRAPDGAARLSLVGLAVFSLFVAGEEISWGQRLLQFRPPAFFLEKNAQQETNLHNLLNGVFDSRWQIFIIALFYGCLSPLLARWAGWFKRFRTLAPRVEIIPLFAMAALLEATYPFELTGEFAELVLGLAIASDVALRSSSGAAHFKPVAMHAFALVGAVAIGPVVDRLAHGSETERTALATSELGALSGDMSRAGALTPKLFRKRYVHKRMFTAVRAGYVDAPLRTGDARVTYYLDPWNQPYWMAYQRHRSKPSIVLLYSFGPNRRRDIVLSPELELRAEDVADDLVVRIELDASRTAASD